ncbi:hypothetical protein PsorP6_017447 [Peronosclerospora sorghi]|uniref:Uncharacterized protein n=1 Tax=Peronosclerospora sorghi TaxID=230839 RepID=A0ACC0WN88_9STRA|nr:hypothetical protein PsorP6_017447 [Peronosclerospora sorghi]
MQSGAQQRSLLVIIIIYGTPAEPLQLWVELATDLSDDYVHRLRQQENEDPSEEKIKSLALKYIAQLLLLLKRRWQTSTSRRLRSRCMSSKATSSLRSSLRLMPTK